MLFEIDFKSGAPVYLQLADQIRYAAASGVLRSGEPLPPIRTLAEQFRVNRNTVAKAYAELESQGVIETIQGKGCFFRQTIRLSKSRSAKNCSSRKLIPPWSRRITCRSGAMNFWHWSKNDSISSNARPPKTISNQRKIHERYHPSSKSKTSPAVTANWTP